MNFEDILTGFGAKWKCDSASNFKHILLNKVFALVDTKLVIISTHHLANIESCGNQEYNHNRKIHTASTN
jgi:hypothetical protein